MIPAFKNQSGKNPKLFITSRHSWFGSDPSILSLLFKLEKPAKSVFQQFDNIVSNVQGAKECRDNRSQSGYINYICATKYTHTQSHTIRSLRVSESVTQLLWALNSLIFNATSSKQSHFFYLMCVWGLLIQAKETTAYFRCVCVCV